MAKRVSLYVVFVVGVVWVLATFVLGLWGKTAAADRLTGDLKPAFSTSGIKQSGADAATVDAFAAELNQKTIPFLADQLGMSQPELEAYLSKNFPAVGKLLGDKANDGSTFADQKSYLVHASNYLDQVTSAIRSNKSNFNDSSDIPSSWLPTKAVAWLFLALGIVTLALGAIALRDPNIGKRAASLTAVVGVVVIAVTFVLGLPGKTKSLDDLTNNFRPVFEGHGALSIGEGAGYLKAVRAADVELETKIVPALPGLLKASPDTVAKALRSNSPVVAAALLEKDPANSKVSILGGILNRFDGLAATVSANGDDFSSTDDLPGLGLPASSVPWLLAGPALLLLLAGYVLLGAPGLAGRLGVASGDLQSANA